KLSKFGSSIGKAIWGDTYPVKSVRHILLLSLFRNWCAFVHSRVLTMVVSCGTEKFIIKSQNPCPEGKADYPVLQPVYREKQKVLTSLQWKCCPGHTGENCEETGEEKAAWYTYRQWERRKENGVDGSTWSNVLWPLQHHSLLPQLQTIIKQQLWPIWDYFNKSIQDLSQEVGGLAESIEELRRGREHNNEPLSSSTSEQLEGKLQHHSRELEKLNIALQAQASKTDEQLHFLQTTVHHNLSSVKIHNDIWSKHTPEKIQVRGINDRGGLMQIQRHVNFQQDSIRMLLRNVSHLQLADHTVHQQLHELQEKDKVRVAEINALSNTFKTLLHDVVRHSKVLQALLGAEVLEFTTEMSSQLGDLSVPAIHRTLQDAIGKINEQKQHLSGVQEKIQQMFLQLSERQTPSYATSPQPTTHSRGVEKTSDNLHLGLHYLNVHLKQLLTNHSELIANLSLEASQIVAIIFVFLNSEIIKTTFNILVFFSDSPHSPVMFLATAFENPASGDGAVFGKVIHNHGKAYSPESGVFEAPVTGIYLFVLTADFGSGHGLGQLMKGNTRMAAVQPPQKKAGGPVTRTALLELKQGEQIHFEIQKDSLKRSTQGDNSFGGVLLFRTV
uniref:Multimerin 2 n=1 Tax=Erpetoichthys calabaricus TaxID=27687 RepID=A0A8C4XAK7_ERPCA